MTRYPKPAVSVLLGLLASILLALAAATAAEAHLAVPGRDSAYVRVRGRHA